MTLLILMPLAFTSLVIPVALSLAGLLCRRRYGWLRLSLWLIAALAVVWALVLGTVLHLRAGDRAGAACRCWRSSGSRGGAQGSRCGVLLPFLVLALCERLLPGAAEGLVPSGSRGGGAPGDHASAAGCR